MFQSMYCVRDSRSPYNPGIPLKFDFQKYKAYKDAEIKRLSQNEYLDLKYDNIFKEFFRHKEALIECLNDVLGYFDKDKIVDVAFLNNDLKTLYGDFQDFIMNVHVKTADGKYFDVVFFREVLAQLKLRNFIEKDILRLSNGGAVLLC